MNTPVLTLRSLAALSKLIPMLSSFAVAKILKLLSLLAKSNSVCPPDTRSVKKGNSGGVASVKMGVRAWACMW